MAEDPAPENGSRRRSRKRKWGDTGEATPPPGQGAPEPNSTPQFGGVPEQVALAAASALAAAAKINASLAASGAATEPPAKRLRPDPLVEPHTREVYINDCPNRHTLIRAATHEDIKRRSGASHVSVRGVYQRVPTPSLGPALHLFVGAATAEAADKAVAIIEEIKNTAPPVSTHEPKAPSMHAKVFVGVPAINDPEFSTVQKVMGPNNEYALHIQSTTGCKVVLKGQGSGFRDTPHGESFEALHLFITCRSKEGLAEAKRLADNLVETVQADYEDFKRSRSQAYLQAGAPQAHHAPPLPAGGGYSNPAQGYPAQQGYGAPQHHPQRPPPPQHPPQGHQQQQAHQPHQPPHHQHHQPPHPQHHQPPHPQHQQPPGPPPSAPPHGYGVSGGPPGSQQQWRGVPQGYGGADQTTAKQGYPHGGPGASDGRTPQGGPPDQRTGGPPIPAHSPHPSSLAPPASARPSSAPPSAPPAAAANPPAPPPPAAAAAAPPPAAAAAAKPTSAEERRAARRRRFKEKNFKEAAAAAPPPAAAKSDRIKFGQVFTKFIPADPDPPDFGRSSAACTFQQEMEAPGGDDEAAMMTMGGQGGAALVGYE